MPFTPAHPAIVAPLLKSRYFSAVALITGSMVPDFEYFFKFRVNSHFSHTISGLFYFDLPVTFFLAWVFLRFVRTNLILNLPLFLQIKLQDVLSINVDEVLWKRWFVFAYSALLGAISHIFWDSFTHNNTWITSNLSIYEGTYIRYGDVKYPLWYALQHVSTGIGLTVMLFVILIQPKKTIIRLASPRLIYWLFIVAMSGVVVIIRFTIKSSDMQEGNIVVTCISGICLALTAGGLINFNNTVLKPSENNG